MTYKKGADGITKQGRTDAKIYPNEGPTVIQNGPKKGPQKLGKSIKAVGRNMARAMLQKSSGRGR
jgi:hypothetical protein